MRAYPNVLHKMKLRRFSDLDLKVVVGMFPGEKLISPVHKVRALVLAEYFKNWLVPVL